MPESALKIHRPQPRILCLDDETAILKSLQRLLQSKGMEVSITTDPEQALALLQHQHFDVFICDMRMPQMSGAEVFAKARDIRPNTQRILLTGFSDFDAIVDAVNQGRIHLYLNKPWHNDELLFAVNKAVDTSHLILHAKTQQAIIEKHNKELESLVEQRTAQLKTLLKEVEQAHQRERKDHKATFEVLYNFINANPYIDGRMAKNIAHTCNEVAKTMHLDDKEIYHCRMAGYLFQIGLLAMDPALYRTPYHELSHDQQRHYMTHPGMARLMLMPAAHLDGVAHTIACQYEHFNGGGTPNELKGSDIPKSAQILSVARDFWVALKEGKALDDKGIEKAKQAILQNSGSFYCPEVVGVLIGLSADKLVESYKTTAGLKVLTTDELAPGMVLAAPLYSRSGIQLLPRGHVINESCISRLQQLQADKPMPFRVMVRNA